MRRLERVGPVLLALWVPLGLQAATPEEDLAVVKRAVERREAARPDGPAARPETSGKPAAKEPQWLRVRIEEKRGRHDKPSRVAINLPLGLVRALGDDDDLIGSDWHDKGGRRIKLSEILRTLDNGQNLVEIEDEDASVRIWVE